MTNNTHDYPYPRVADRIERVRKHIESIEGIERHTRVNLNCCEREYVEGNFVIVIVVGDISPGEKFVHSKHILSESNIALLACIPG